MSTNRWGYVRGWNRRACVVREVCPDMWGRVVYSAAPFLPYYRRTKPTLSVDDDSRSVVTTVAVCDSMATAEALAEDFNRISWPTNMEIDMLVGGANQTKDNQ